MPRRFGLTRRQFVALASAGGLSLAPRLAGTVAAGAATPASGWIYRDDRGVTISLPSTPASVVAYVGIAAALFDVGVTVSGYYSGLAKAPALIGDRAGLAKTTDLGPGDKLTAKALTSSGADLLVGPNFDLKGMQAVWPVPADVSFPATVAISYTGVDAEGVIVSVERLASALTGVTIEGVDADFQNALDSLKVTILASPGFSAAWIVGNADGFTLTVSSPDVILFKRLGLDSLTGTGTRQKWSEFAALDCRLIMVDDRAAASWQPSELKAKVPEFANHPAVAAGAVGAWQAEFVPSRKGFTPVVDALTAAIAAAGFAAV